MASIARQAAAIEHENAQYHRPYIPPWRHRPPHRGDPLKEVFMYYFDVDADGKYPFSQVIINETLRECISALMVSESIPFEEAAAKLGCTNAKITELKQRMEVNCEFDG